MKEQGKNLQDQINEDDIYICGHYSMAMLELPCMLVQVVHCTRAPQLRYYYSQYRDHKFLYFL